MNDLTFGATLLACLTGLIATAVLEATTAPAGRAPTVDGTAAVAPPARAHESHCITTVAQAPTAAR